MENINILIIEDEALIAEDIRDMVQKLGYSVSGILANGDKALDYLGFHYPDVVLCDIMIKGTKDGIQIAEWLRKNRKIPFIFLTSLSDRHTLDRAKTTLPYGYIVKPFDEKDLVTSIEVALYKFSQEVESMKITRDKLNLLCDGPLTEREYEIMTEVLNGLNNEQIGKKIFLSNNTIKYHIKNLMTKFHAANRGEILQKIINKWMTSN
mgnify:CR=1 FL=1